MATPQQGQTPYPQPGYSNQPPDGHDVGQQDDPADQPHAPGAPPAASGPGRKKRHYAGQAYEFGGNAALGGQQPGGAPYQSPQQPAYGAYGQQQQQPQQQQQSPQVPQYGSGPASPAVGGAPAYGQQPGAMGGYQSPEQGYSAGAPAQQPGVGGITADMSRMSVSNQGPQHPPGRLPMNQLYPTDLMNTTLNVAELELPPPPIVLPPNVSQHLFEAMGEANNDRRASLLHLTPIAHRSMYGRH